MSSYTATASANIVWGTPIAITGDADVSLSGTGVWAISADANGTMTTLVNPVTFTQATCAVAVAIGFTTDIGNDTMVLSMQMV